MTNLERIKNQIINEVDRGHTFGCTCHYLRTNGQKCSGDCKLCTRMTLEWMVAEYREPILTDLGKDYLLRLISTFSVEDIVKIFKVVTSFTSNIRLWVVLKSTTIRVDFCRDSDLDELFKNMEFERTYTAKDLGL